MTNEWIYIGESKDFKENEPTKAEALSTRIVLVRKNSVLKAFVDRCPHRGYPLSINSKEKDPNLALRCAYHGWSFDCDGKLHSRPGFDEKSAPGYCLPALSVIESGGFVFVSFTSKREEAQVPQWLTNLADPKMKVISVSQKLNASALHVLENLLDPFHTHFVHTSFLRSSPIRHKVDVVADYSQAEKTLTVEYFNEPTPTGWVSRLFEDKRVKTLGRYHHNNSAVLEYWTEYGLDLRVTLPVNELSETSCLGVIIFQISDRGLPFFLKRPLFKFFINNLVRQDKKALEELQDNLNHFPDRAYWSGNEDVVLQTIRQLKAGKDLPDFKKNIVMHL